jgi:hypothetical protein
MQGDNSSCRFVAPRSCGWRKGVTAMLVVGLGLAAQAACAAEAFPVVRFYNERTSTHFYTIDPAERDKVLSLYPWFDYEGVQFYAYKDAANGGQAVERFFNTKTGTHFYTISQAEKTFVIQNYPVFVYEGPAYYAMTATGTDRTDLYRFYNTRTGAHFYTTSAAERDHVQATWPWFTYEGVAFEVFTSATPSNGGTGGSGPKASLAGSASTVTAPASVTLTATANDSGATITKVEFYSGSTKIGEATAAPYSLTYNITQAATYLFSAVASDSLGATAASNTWTVQASSGGGSANVAPKATLGVSSTTFTAGGSITMTATATDTDGTIAKVMFYEGANKLGEATTAPYTL